MRNFETPSYDNSMMQWPIILLAQANISVCLSAVTISRNSRSRYRHGTVTGCFGITSKSVTIDRNGRSRSAGIVGHDGPKWSVTMVRYTHQAKYRSRKELQQ